ncbi:MAG: 2TM domain-containing protein [Algicola sp.]|nr:2TM domain-containing protein [Algicola sp.]
MKNLTEDRYSRAKERVENLKAFFYSMVSYCVIIPLLVYVNYRTTDFPWVLFPAAGWGLGLLFQWMTAYGRNPVLGKEWEERKIQEFMGNKEF